MNYQANYEKWLSDPRLSDEGRKELREIAGDEKAKEYRYGGELEFGTAGMRGIIGYGMNMMNVYTVMRATQGLAESSFPTTRGANPRNSRGQRRAYWQRTASRRISSTTCTPFPCSPMR